MILPMVRIKQKVIMTTLLMADSIITKQNSNPLLNKEIKIYSKKNRVNRHRTIKLRESKVNQSL